MNRDPFEYLSLSLDQCTHLTGRRRTRLVSFLLRWEQYETALTYLDRALATSPGRVGLLDAKARALWGLGQIDAAIKVMNARHQISASLSSRVILARIHLAGGNVPAALAIARQWTTERPDSIMAWGLLGAVHLEQNDSKAAEVVFHRLAKTWPNSQTYLLGMLALYQARGDFVTASGYAARLQRTVAEGRALTANTLRRLQDYFLKSGEINRSQEIGVELDSLYQVELDELEKALTGAPEAATGKRIRPVSKPTPTPAVDTEPPPEPPPLPDSIPVSDRERRRLEDATRRFFGFETMLPGQTETMAAVLRQQDILTILPTGGGKSLCYQIPALLDESGTTLVISPLIALMKDQVDSLPPEARRRATTINSSLDGNELNRRMNDVSAGRYRLVYAAPERMRQPPFLHALRRCGVNRLVIDEAHCVSVWGHDFRPDYLTINRARQALGNPSLLAMTATAPPRVRRDIIQRMGNREVAAESKSTGQVAEMAVVATKAHRPNLYLAATWARNADEKLQYLLSYCQAEKGNGIVYAGTRQRCERIAALLRDRGISAAHYHAGIANRATVQDDFMSGRVRVIVATIAFGMGIDKADIRFIIHTQLPSSLEAYFQEVGRAGRDGLAARCILIYSTADRGTLTRRAKRGALSVEFLRSVYAAIKGRLGESSLGRVASYDLMRDVVAEETPVRVALSMLEEASLLKRHQDVARTAVVRLCGRHSDHQKGKQDTAWSSFVSTARLQPGQSLPLDLIAVAEQSGLDVITIEERVLTWADAGWLSYHPAGRDLLLELLPPPPDAATRIEGLIDRYAMIQAQRVDEIAAYAATRRCRHGHISAYLSGQPMEACSSCDNCRPDALPAAKPLTELGLPDEVEQLRIILRCVADAPWSWGRGSLIKILRGSNGAPEKGRESSEWRTLAFRSQAAVEQLLDRLIAVGLLRPRTLGNGGVVLDLAAAGRAALHDPTWLPPTPAAKPSKPSNATAGREQEAEEVGPLDETLYQQLRTWRRETADAAGVPAFVVAHDKLLKRIAAIRPRNEDELMRVKGMGPKRMEQYGPAILALVGKCSNHS